MESVRIIIYGLLVLIAQGCKPAKNDPMHFSEVSKQGTSEFAGPKCTVVSEETQISNEDGCNYDAELNEANGYSTEIKVDFNSSLLNGRAPLINTKIENLPEGYESLETNTFLDVIAYTNTGPSLWSFTKDHVMGTVSRYLSLIHI